MRCYSVLPTSFMQWNNCYTADALSSEIPSANGFCAMIPVSLNRKKNPNTLLNHLELPLDISNGKKLNKHLSVKSINYNWCSWHFLINSNGDSLTPFFLFCWGCKLLNLEQKPRFLIGRRKYWHLDPWRQKGFKPQLKSIGWRY